MALKATLVGRAQLTRDLNAFIPNATKYLADANYQIVQEAAEKMRDAAPRGATLEYAESIDGDFLKNRPNVQNVSNNPTKDKDAAGIYASWIWRFLEFGTAPHNTAPGGGTVKGRSDFAQGNGHLHPGTAAQPHIFPTWNAFKATAQKMKRAAVNKAVREIMKK